MGSICSNWFAPWCPGCTTVAQVACAPGAAERERSSAPSLTQALALTLQAPAESLNTAFMLHRPEAISMTAMLDEHVTPVGLPLGLTDLEKQMWLAIYSAAR